MVDENALRKAIGLADACELLASAAGFPDGALADALSDGRLVADAQSCLEDADVPAERASAICEPWRQLVGRDRTALLADLRRAYSLLFVRQGDGVAVWPYESAYLHAEAGRPGEPALFRSAVTLDVEHMMSEAGGLPPDARVEPCDSVWHEFMFLSYLLGSEAEALDAGDGDAAALARSRAEAFAEGHASRWLPGFFGSVERELPALVQPQDGSHLFYEGLCSYGMQALDLISSHLTRE